MLAIIIINIVSPLHNNTPVRQPNHFFQDRCSELLLINSSLNIPLPRNLRVESRHARLNTEYNVILLFSQTNDANGFLSSRTKKERKK